MKALRWPNNIYHSGILLDLQLPVISGWQVMDELKSDANTRLIPVHIMSAYEVKTKKPVQRARVDFINKPVAFEKAGRNVLKDRERIEPAT